MNRLSKWMLAAIFMICGTMTVFADGDEKNGKAYLTQAELPDMSNFLPPPPEFESARFVADQTQYLWGKRQRQNKERAEMAIRDANYGMQTIIQEFCPILGLEITKEDTPEATVSATVPNKNTCAGVHSCTTTSQPSCQSKRRSTAPTVPTLRVTLFSAGRWLCCCPTSTLLQPTPYWLVATSMDRVASLPATTGRATWMQVVWELQSSMQSYKAISVSVSSWQKLNRNLQKRQALQLA